MWSRNYPCCVVCSGTDSRMMADGHCARCYLKEYRKNHGAKIAAQKKDWYNQFVKGTDVGKLRREENYFDSKRDAILKRDGYKCVKCSSIKSLVVHHRDGRDRSVKTPNNNMRNLETNCRACHINAHRQELLAARRKNNFRRPKIGHYKNWKGYK
jgi:hypothetical protein